MCKKFVVTGILAAVVAFVLFGGATFSHISHGVGWLRAEVEDSVPVEMKLDKARDAIEASEPKIRELNRTIAEKQVEIRYLERELAGLRQARTTQRAVLETQRQALTVDQASYRFRGVEVSRARMRMDADRRLHDLKNADQLIASKEARLEALSNGLGHVRVALDTLIAKREELITQCEMLEAKRRETEAKKAVTLNIEVDGSDLAEAADILARIERQLDVEMQVMENEQPLIGDGLGIAPELDDVESRISAYLDGPEAPAAELSPADCEALPALKSLPAGYIRND
ncbi:MAG: hypothetical protein H6807_10875 [Planctomycetes bacterium]|nr:hypothetical protein [Planctomycetota bacterium]